MKFTPSTPSRALNTTFTPSASNATMVIYTVEIATTATLAANQLGIVELRSDTNATPTTVRCSVSSGVNLTLGVAIGFTTSQRAVLSHIVPPGHNVRLVSTLTGSPTVTIVNQTEIAITPEFDGVDFATGFPSK